MSGMSKRAAWWWVSLVAFVVGCGEEGWGLQAWPAAFGC